MKKKKVTIGCLLAAFLIFLCQMPTAATSISSITSKSIKKKQDQIEQMEKEQKGLKNSLTNLQQVKKDLENQKSNLKDYVAQLDSKLAEIEQNISELNEKITSKEQDIEQTRIELDDALATEEAQNESMVIRIRLMYEQSNDQLIATLLGSTNFNEFLNRADYIERVVACDRQMYEEYKTNRQLVELCKEQLELEKSILDQTKENVEIEQAALEELIDQKNQDILKYETDINNKAQAIAEYEQMIKEQDAEIAALEAAIAAEKKKILENSGKVITYDGGVFKFPLASYTRVSDEYGMRIHPTLGVEQFHNGIDLAAPKGTVIYAAYDGKVVAAANNATMGNYVMIDHGDDLYTIYMHASALYVKDGDIVVRGEKIAAVGSTGRSTGNHLHFGVRKNGAYVSPWNYLSQ